MLPTEKVQVLAQRENAARRFGPLPGVNGRRKTKFLSQRIFYQWPSNHVRMA